MVTHGLREALVTAGNFPELLTAEQVSALLGISAATLNRWASIRNKSDKNSLLSTRRLRRKPTNDSNDD